MKEIVISWTDSLVEQWIDRERQGRLPHAVMLTGAPGVGKRAMARWMVGRKLGLSVGDRPVWPLQPLEHADLHWLSPPEEKTSILIDQVRTLVADLSLTSYEGRGKAAVIEPAQLMTHNAANSLLKTLEEPPGDALLILVADRTGRLPATIMSRCQRIDIAVPGQAEGLAWLDRLRPGTEWVAALRAAGGAPVAAIAAADRLDLSRAMATDLARVGSGSASPVDVALAWSKHDPAFVLEWLAREVQAAARLQAGDSSRPPDPAIGDSVLQRMDSHGLFCYLDDINRLRGQPRGSYNVQLALETLLIDWATRLTDVGAKRAQG